MAVKSFVSKEPIPIVFPDDEGPKRSIFWIRPMTGRAHATYQNRQEFAREEIRRAAIEETIETADRVTNRIQDQMTELFVDYIPRIENVWLGDEWKDELTEKPVRREFFDGLALMERALLLGLLSSGGKLQAYTFRDHAVDGAAKRARPHGKGRNKGTHKGS